MYGEFLTIMGRSGAGKSSFLSILTGRLTAKTKGFRLEGKMLLNGEMYDSSQFSKCAAYVRQDDIILGTLTVEETFEFQAKLKLH
jgi:ABC-type multidrug transport system ATPase subunit